MYCFAPRKGRIYLLFSFALHFLAIKGRVYKKFTLNINIIIDFNREWW